MDGPEVRTPKITVWGVVPGDPPSRMVQIGDTIVGIARSFTDVIEIALREGLRHVDLDDPSVVRWVGGGEYHWSP